MSLTPVHPKLEQFRHVHAEVAERLNGLISPNAQLPNFFAYCRTTVVPLLDLEERVLFSLIFQKAGIQAGGPLCMLYYDMHLNMPSLDRAASICEKPRLNPLKMAHAPARRAFYDVNSPVCIPLEDHLACAQILDQADLWLREASTIESDSEIVKLAFVFLSILKGNFEKKDHCLLPMAQQLLSLEELEGIPDLRS